ncbi:MAG: methylenetetrahydrofolate reductase [NAD(P)H] [Synergistales bacterium]|nr:methylenetetrahydrofolate reductase [NAD(P)H] [Synergistaceae bacterium]MDY6399831.1 methylenetetrahydrofolate reductase [NAD(P)H] [Synergistales bacterium]MDY6401597.1 methylenetetrahydrofolate reductase [NAD(P)H] [Synergistales bacterium]MDY6404871.1 methylenetetrahydrofolate reductase [NAD(P)H] [Synergistales bacterium]MDY6410597.1 methylenetetrahydrofolate reductase [NAD(P)H] [Synergistales bacterium]
MENFFEKIAPSYTFEIFPPKGNASTAGTYAVIDSLVSFNPDLISVTYGAGGSSRDNTVEITSGIQNKYNVCGVAHLTCVGTTRAELKAILDRLKANNVRNVLALRGDLKDESDLGEFHHASELISFIKEEYGNEFDIFAACYPEKHPESKSVEEDLIHLKEKCDLGVKGLISQLFFDNDIFCEWREKARAMGIKQPIIAGVMPITSAVQISKVVELCGASVPDRVRRFVNAYGHNQGAIKEAGIAYATEQIIDLLTRDVEGIHLYTMNQADTVRRIDAGIRSVLYTKRYALRSDR